jgi:hypothetical protein
VPVDARGAQCRLSQRRHQTRRPHDSPRGGILTTADDHIAIVEACTKFHWFYDRKQWDDLGALLDDVVSMPTLEEIGDDVEGYLERYHRTRADVTAGLRLFADGLVTQHLVAGHLVTITGDTAVCIAHGINVHLRDEDRTAPPLWHGNTYRFDLVRRAEGWRIAGMVAGIVWGWGDDSVHDVSAKQRVWVKTLDADGAPSSGV